MNEKIKEIEEGLKKRKIMSREERTQYNRLNILFNGEDDDIQCLLSYIKELERALEYTNETAEMMAKAHRGAKAQIEEQLRISQEAHADTMNGQAQRIKELIDEGGEDCRQHNLMVEQLSKRIKEADLRHQEDNQVIGYWTRKVKELEEAIKKYESRPWDCLRGDEFEQELYKVLEEVK